VSAGSIGDSWGDSWTVPAEHAGERLDRALAEHAGVPRSRIQRWIATGRVTIDGAPPVKSGEPLRAGARVEWRPPPAFDERIVPEAGALAILHADADLIALDKPADLVVHPGAGRSAGTLAHRLLAAYPELAGVGGPGRPGIVHRLDRGTSGLLVVARNADSYQALGKAFAERRVDKRYLAIVWGTPKESEGTIERPIGRHPVDRKRMAVRPRGRPARTVWRRLAAGGPISLLEVELHTGRTHQIRVHLRTIGHPLVGDPVYGEPRHRTLRGPAAAALAAFPRPALHAWRLALDHPGTGARLALEARVPDDLAALWHDVTGAELPPLPAAHASSRRDG
jgi:23S rRNA pseudouridine1911/1915/1917 synthase